MSTGPDFAVYSPDDKLQLVVEVKGTPRTDLNWAAKLRRNLLAHGAVPSAPYFLLVVPDQLYLWSHATEGSDALPDFHADTSKVLSRYLAIWERDAATSTISERGLELAVRSWLSDLTGSASWSERERQANEWLRSSGLPESVRTGTVKAESAV